MNTRRLLPFPLLVVAASAWAADAGTGDAPIGLAEPDARIVVPLDVDALAGRAGGFDAPETAELDGRELMEAVHAAHQQYPFVYEELSMVLIDRRDARRTRQLRRYSRVDDDGRVSLLLLFDTPAEVEGVALLAHIQDGGVQDVGIYLPALDGRFVESDADVVDSAFLGTDFTVEDFTGERLDDYRYVRRRGRSIEGVPHHVVDVFAAGEDVNSARALRRHYVRADVLFVTRTEHYDDLGRIQRRHSTHDLARVDGNMWCGNMLLMEDLQSAHSTLVKIDRRVFSRDYVPAEMFSEQWLRRTYPPGGGDAPEADDAAASETVAGR